VETENLAIFSVLWAVVYLSIASLVLRRRGEAVARAVSLYGAAAAIWEIGLALLYQGWFTPQAPNFLMWHVTMGGYILTLFFLLVNLEFLQANREARTWFWLGLVWGVCLLLAVTDLLPLSRLMPEASRVTLLRVVIALSWLTLFFSMGMATIVAYYRASQPLHKNRLIFWILALGFIAGGDALLLADATALGEGLRIIGVVIAAYVALTHNLIDLFEMALKSILLLLTTSLAVVAYAGIFLIMQAQIQSAWQLNPWLWGLILAILSVFMVNPVLNLVNRAVNRLVLGKQYDPGAIVRGYSMGINNIVELNLLARTAQQLLVKTFDIERVYLFLVDETIEDGVGYYLLRYVTVNEEDSNRDGRLRVNDPVAVYLNQAKKPLTQYDIDLLPPFKAISAETRAWLNSLGVDVLVPIFSRNGWVGMLTLGPKLSGVRYFDDELVLLTTLADQTAVALENARLFSDTVKLNEDLVRAQKALEAANLHLREMDEVKSAFIGVITHELRTPFANMAFSLQLLNLYGRESFTPEQREQLQQLNASLRSARQMVDNLVMLASFLNKQVELGIESLLMRDLIVDALTPLKDMAKDKGVSLQLEMVGDLKAVIGDRNLLTNAIAQLVHNAIKFNKSGGKVWLTCWMMDEQVYLDVKDTGIGVPAEKLPLLWDIFTQVADPLRRGVEGLGLGLALVKYIVAAHGGHVWAESQPGEGSVFGFCLPTVRSKSLPIHLAVTSPPAKT